MFVVINPNNILGNNIRHVSNSNCSDSGSGNAAQPYCSISVAAQALQYAGSGKADGGIIKLHPGSYSISQVNISTDKRYLTLMPVEGASRDQVRIISHSGKGINTKLLKIFNLTVEAMFNTDPWVGHKLWMDQVHLKGPGQHVDFDLWFPSNYPWQWNMLTNSLVTDSEFGPNAVYYQSNNTIQRIGADVFRWPSVMFNITIDNVDPGSTGWHSDVFEITTINTNSQYHLENTLYYNVTCTNCNAQGLFIGGGGTNIDNMAIVNFVLHKGGGFWTSQFYPIHAKHFIIQNSTFANETFLFRTRPSTGVTESNVDWQDFVIRGNIFAATGASPQYPVSIDQNWFSDNHFIDDNQIGLGATGGSSNIFMDSAALDFRPAPGSIVKERISPDQNRGDREGVIRDNPTSLGAFN
jgi:hypothetical protein